MRELIPARFRREILLHLYKNLMPEAGGGVPLILGIHGPSGQGKTYQCHKVLDEIDAHVSLISCGELESVDAGEPARVIREAYLDCASTRSQSAGGFGPAALVINDVDAAVGQWGELVQYTVNRQNVFGELMNLADSPTLVERQRVKRVPVILTGNDFTKLYPPLVRSGRMHSFVWTPTAEERNRILESIFPDLAGAEIARLSENFTEQPIAFFSHLRSQIYDDLFWNYIEEVGVHESFSRISAGQSPPGNAVLSFDALNSLGVEMLEKGRLVDHLVG
ncbi:AAA family ATPase [Streptomyces sp. NPDC049915]|uniref:AAA family ATPase n=1 Tax=Streptomyces sp. NPDC049915 TaxID=3155510 RepID=UPI00343762D1